MTSQYKTQTLFCKKFGRICTETNRSRMHRHHSLNTDFSQLRDILLGNG